ncbi:MAG: aminotransferase class V-fold PLP-dependent enzyme, partial [Clostridia bacterium]|nr:aminotransferase class V-fold PLP-dependent enzyme [Clostridia bacterium]
MIYLDNAATTFPKPGCVIKEFLSVIKNDGGNPARSSHRLSVGATERIYKARESIARLLSVKDPERIVFTYNATQSLNLAIKCCIPDNSHVICSDIEHNAVIRPLEKAKRTKGISYSLYD